MDRQMSRAVKCPCGSNSCRDWLIDPEAYVQGVSFTQEQAEAVAHLLNSLALAKQDELEE